MRWALSQPEGMGEMPTRWWRRIPRPLSCEEALDVLQSYIDSETSTETARQVIVHLEQCGPCENERKMYQRIKLGLSQREPEVDPVILSALQRFGQRLSLEGINDTDSDSGLI